MEYNGLAPQCSLAVLCFIGLAADGGTGTVDIFILRRLSRSKAVKEQGNTLIMSSCQLFWKFEVVYLQSSYPCEKLPYKLVKKANYTLNSDVAFYYPV